MKKLFLTIFIVLLSVLLVVGCQNEEDINNDSVGQTVEFEKEKQAFDTFTSAKNIQFSIYGRFGDNGETIFEKAVELAIAGEKIQITFDGMDANLIYVGTNKNIYYERTIGITEYKFISNLGELTEESEDKNSVLNLSDCITNVVYKDSLIEFDFDVASIYTAIMGESDDGTEIPPMKATVTIENNAVKEIILDVGTMIKDMLGITSDVEEFSIVIKDIKYGNVKINPPLVAVSGYKRLSVEDFIKLIMEELGFVTEIPNYEMQLNVSDYCITEGKDLILDGIIKLDGKTVAKLADCTVMFEPQLDLTKIGKTEYLIGVNTGYSVLTATITVTVLQKEESTGSIELDVDGIYRIFDADGNKLIASKNKLYKYDIKNNQKLGEVDLIYTANSIYTKDGFLYVAANDLDSERYLEDDEYRGTVSKIKLEDFSLVNQVTVNCYPYSIFVDKRDNVIIGKGLDQWIEYSIVDMTTGNLSSVTYGYNMDYLIYNEQKDAFLSVTQSISSGNDWYYYKNNGYQQGEESENKINDVIKIYYNGRIVLDTVFANEFTIAIYDSNKKDYVTKKYTYGVLSGYDSFSYSQFIELDGGKVYRVTGPSGFWGTACIVIYDTVTNEVEYRLVKIDSADITNMAVVDGVVYVNYDNDNKLYAYEIN